MKKTAFLLATIVLLATAWSGGWFYVAKKVEETLSIGKSRLANQNKIFQCANQEIGGFPFRIQLTCDETTYIDNNQSFSLEAGEMRSGAQAYQPGKAVLEVDAPAIMVLGERDVFELDWSSLRASVNAGLSGLLAFSTVSKALNVNPARPELEAIAISELQLHGRKVNADDIDFAIVSQGVASAEDRWPKFDLTINVRITEVYQKLTRNPDLRKLIFKDGIEGQITELTYAPTSGGKVEVNGPVSVTKYGILSGKFNLKVSQVKSLISALSKAFPNQADMLRQAEAAAGLISAGQNGGQLELPITIREGRASIGIIPIGNIPPLF